MKLSNTNNPKQFNTTLVLIGLSIISLFSCGSEKSEDQSKNHEREIYAIIDSLPEIQKVEENQIDSNLVVLNYDHADSLKEFKPVRLYRHVKTLDQLFVPGMEVLNLAMGDLDNDYWPDYILVLRNRSPENFRPDEFREGDYNASPLVVVLYRHTYEGFFLWDYNWKIFGRRQGLHMESTVGEIVVDSNGLVLRNIGASSMSTQRGGGRYVLRYDKEQFVLVKYSEFTMDRAMGVMYETTLNLKEKHLYEESSDVFGYGSIQDWDTTIPFEKDTLIAFRELDWNVSFEEVSGYDPY